MEKPTYTSTSKRFEGEFYRPKEGRTLIVGSYVVEGKEDRRTLFKDVVGLDMRKGPGVDYIWDLEEAPPTSLGLFDNIECLSVLEHSRRPWELARNIEGLLVPNGTLYVAAPFVWRVHGYPDDYWRFTASGIKELFPNITWLEMRYANEKLSSKYSSIRECFEGHVFLARTEICGFGVKECAS